MDDYSTCPQKAICLDVETTGINPSTAEILQLSIIDYNGEVLFNEYIKPDKAKTWPDAEKVHHISPSQVSNKPHLKFYHDRLRKIFDNAELIIAYNGDHYDIPVIARYGFQELLAKRSFDVMLEFAPIFGAWDESHQSYTWQKLAVCADYYGYDNEDASYHDSLEDVRATLFCYKKMAKGNSIHSKNEGETLAASYDYDKLAQRLESECEDIEKYDYYPEFYQGSIYNEEAQREEASSILRSICLKKTLRIAKIVLGKKRFDREKHDIKEVLESYGFYEVKVIGYDGEEMESDWILENHYPYNHDEITNSIEGCIRNFFGISFLYEYTSEAMR